LLPTHIGRYRVDLVLGEGGFGRVYRGYDDRLCRQVAIKVPHRRLLARSAKATDYLAEAQNVAKLDHPHIVPVYDVGQTDEFPCFVVSKFVEGAGLDARLQRGRMPHIEVANLVAAVAEALHYAHKQNLVHRDVKPANILIDRFGKAYLADFGLALRDEELGCGPRLAGTPAYMSPEQARGEGDRVDGRSDVFSLGVVLYELLAGRRPFRGADTQQVLEQIKTLDPRPPRQIDDTIPPGLERICLKCLAKDAAARYTTANDLAADLRECLHRPERKPEKPAVDPISIWMFIVLVLLAPLAIVIAWSRWPAADLGLRAAAFAPAASADASPPRASQAAEPLPEGIEDSAADLAPPPMPEPPPGPMKLILSTFVCKATSDFDDDGDEVLIAVHVDGEELSLPHPDKTSKGRACKILKTGETWELARTIEFHQQVKVEVQECDPLVDDDLLSIVIDRDAHRRRTANATASWGHGRFELKWKWLDPDGS
jgi:hypothetical protein